MVTTLFLFNGSKKKGPKLHKFLDHCQEKLGEQFLFISSNYEKELIEVAQRYASNVEVIVVLGGDGTLNEVINGLLNSKVVDLPRIAIIPRGTGNDFFQSAGFNPVNFTNFLDFLSQENSMCCDIGKIQTEKEVRYFINVADIGFGGAVVLSLNKFRKQFGPGFSYSLAILKTFFKYKRSHVQIESDEFTYKGELLLAAACNGAIFGNGLHIHPGASISDGQMNMTILAKVSLLDYLLNVGKVKRGYRIKHPEAHYFACNHLILNAKNTLLHAETDGEYLSGKHFEISILPQRIKIHTY